MEDSEFEKSDLVGLFQEEEEADIAGNSQIWFIQFQKAGEQKEKTILDTIDNAQQEVKGHLCKVLMKEENHVIGCEKTVLEHKDNSILKIGEFDESCHEENFSSLIQKSKEYIEEDTFWDEMELFCSRFDVKPVSHKLEDNEQLEKDENQESIFQDGGFDICSSPQESSTQEFCSSLVDIFL